MNIVDLSRYRSFCFRGEGRCNFVISAKETATDSRIVWRLAKHRKSGMISPKPKCEIVNQYLERVVSHFLSPTCLIRPNVVFILFDELHHLAKIPALPHNRKVETWEELKAAQAFFSFFHCPTAILSANDEEGTAAASLRLRTNSFDASHFPAGCVCALEMPDATRIPRQPQHVQGPTITIEIKPKQGFAQSHPGLEDIPYCNNCILQIEKWRSHAFTAMYDFCPLDLYSGDQRRMYASLESLVHDPHRNLRVFVNGTVVHEEGCVQSRDTLAALCFPHRLAASDDGSEPLFDGVGFLVTATACILAGVRDDTTEEFRLTDKSILRQLLSAQRVDNIGIVRAHELYCSLPADVQRELMDKSNLLRYSDLSFLRRSDSRSLVERYLLAATMKDCSLMVSLRLLDQHNAIALHADPTQRIVRVGTLYVAYSMRIVDLDPKSAKNLENAYSRFVTGVESIRANRDIHPACRI